MKEGRSTSNQVSLWSKPSQGLRFHLEWNLTSFPVGARPWAILPCLPVCALLLFWACRASCPFLWHPAWLHAHPQLRASLQLFRQKEGEIHLFLGLSPKLTFPDPLLYVTLLWLVCSLVTDISVFLFTCPFVCLSPTFTTTWKCSP